MMNSSLIDQAATVVPVVDDNLMTKRQAAERIAVSARTIDRMVAMRRLEKIFVGASTRFRKSDIDRIVAKGI